VTDLDYIARIADLELALRLVVFVWIVSVVILRALPTGECDPACNRCSIYRNTDICPMCFKRHDRKERCQ
jgi:hypothetical protein